MKKCILSMLILPVLIFGAGDGQISARNIVLGPFDAAGGLSAIQVVDGIPIPFVRINSGPLSGASGEGCIEQRIRMPESPETSAAVAPEDKSDSRQTLNEVIRAAAALIRENYVDSAAGQRIHDGLLEFSKAAVPGGEGSGEKLAAALSARLFEMGKDKHLRVVFDPRRAREMDQWDALGEREKAGIEAARAEQNARLNFGFRRAEILEGNVGCLDFHIFDKSDAGLKTAAVALNFVAHADAVILDLRSNRGGHSRMVAMIAACFLEGRVHLNTFVDRDGNVREEIWTPDDHDGPDLTRADLYLLVGPRTASAAESFAYMMKGLKRATLVGEPTAGAANPGGFFHAGGGFLVFIPTGKPVSPFTGTNWEGVGIEPDITVPEAQALQRAHSMALSKRRDGNS